MLDLCSDQVSWKARRRTSARITYWWKVFFSPFQKPYRDPKADYEELLVRRNAPRWLSELKKFGILRMDSNGTCTIHR